MIEIKVTHVLDEFQFKTLVEMLGGAKVSPPLEVKPEEEYGDWVPLEKAASLLKTSTDYLMQWLETSPVVSKDVPRYRVVNDQQCINMVNLRSFAGSHLW